MALSGVAGDPDGDTLSASWSGDGATFTDKTALRTTAAFAEAGRYTLTLAVGDGSTTVSDKVNVTVTDAPLGTGTWETLPPTATARQEVSYVQLGGKFYLAGGSALHEVYDPVARTWGTLEPLPKNLDHIQGVSVGGNIYYLGGLAGWPGPAVRTVHIYDPATDSFTEGAPLPEGRGAGGVAVFGGKIYYAGGLSDFEAQTSFDVYDPATDSWAELPEMPHARDHFHAAVVDGVFYAVGGRVAKLNATIPFVDAFDFKTQTWTTLDTGLPTERGGFATAVLGGEILVIGGEGAGRTRKSRRTTRLRTCGGPSSPCPRPVTAFKPPFVTAVSTSLRAASNKVSARLPYTKSFHWESSNPARSKRYGKHLGKTRLRCPKGDCTKLSYAASLSFNSSFDPFLRARSNAQTPRRLPR